MAHHRNILGLSVAEKRITAAEVVTSAGERSIIRTAELELTDEVGFEQGEALGKALKSVLREKGITANRCVIGLPATWIVAKEKAMPAADDAAMRSALALVAEREFASDADELAMDYTRRTSDQAGTVVLAAVQRRIIERTKTVADSAGLTVTAVTSSAAALAAATVDGHDGRRLILSLLPRGVELVAQTGAHVRMLRHLPVPVEHSQRLTGELKRILALSPAPSGQRDQLLIWDAVGVDRNAVTQLESRLDMTVTFCSLSNNLGITDGSAAGTDQRFAPAAALAALETMPIDFIHSRLAPPKTSRITRPMVWAAIIAVLILATGGYLYVDWRASNRQVHQLQTQLADMHDATMQARELIDNVSFARAWYDRRPPFLDLLRQITLAFPQEGTVWAVSILIHEDLQATLTGKAVSESAALALLDRMKSDPTLVEVKPLFIRQSGTTSRDVSFAVSVRLHGDR